MITKTGESKSQQRRLAIQKPLSLMRELAQKATPGQRRVGKGSPHGRVLIGENLLARIESDREDAYFIAACSPDRILAYEDCVEALREITKGAGEFNIDPFEHAKNCIYDMKLLARAALAALAAQEQKP